MHNHKTIHCWKIKGLELSEGYVVSTELYYLKSSHILRAKNWLCVENVKYNYFSKEFQV